jgi:hypothetical protein
MKIAIILLFVGQVASAKIAFQKQTETQRLIVVADDDGTNQHVISNPKLDTYHADISSDGRYVAYSRGAIKSGQDTDVEIVIRDLEAGIVEVWTEKGDQYIHAEFSGNDRYLAYSGMNLENGRQNIHIIDLKKERLVAPVEVSMIDGELTYIYDADIEVVESDFDCYAPAVASDGAFVIYHQTLNKADKSAPKQLVMFNRGSGDFTELTEQNKHAMFPTLSADERLVAYVSKNSGQWDIYLYDMWQKTTRAVTEDENIEFTPVFAADNSLYYTRFAPNESGESQIDIYYINKDQVLDSSLKVEPIAFLTDPEVAEYVVSFSNPDGLKNERLADIPSPERSSFGAVFHNGQIYIAGGHKGAGHSYPRDSFLNQLEVYNLERNTWQTLAPMPSAKHGFQMVGHKNFLYVFGGFAFSDDHLPKWKSLDSIDRYDISKNLWETLEVKLPVARSSNAIAKIDDKVFLLGGWNSTPKFENDKEGLFLRGVDTFDLKTETVFENEFEIPDPLRRALTAVVVDEEIHLLGGIGVGSSHFEWIDDVSVFNSKTKVWRDLPPLPFATFAPGVGELGGDLYLIGGMILKNKDTYDLNYVDDVYKFDQKKQTWSHTGLFLDANKGFPQVVPMPGNALGVLGGHTFDYTPEGVLDKPVKTFERISF